MRARSVVTASAEGPIIACDEPLSFWGGIDPARGTVIDVHHPLHGQNISGAILMMPSTRGSCSGSGVLLDLALSGRGPAALIFCEPEDVVTLGALIASEMFGCKLPVLRLSEDDFAALARENFASITPKAVRAGQMDLQLEDAGNGALVLTDRDEAMLAGLHGTAAKQAMRIVCAMAAQQGATELIDVTQAHIDGCIYASPANLTFAEKMAGMGAKVCVPTTMNAISVDHLNWKAQGVAAEFGNPSQRLADVYVQMGCQPTFTCAPYLLPTAPAKGEAIAWAESNAVVYANSVLGARTAKHPDFLDLCIALTGRTPLAGVYLDEHRRARRVIDIDLPDGVDDAFWPLVGYLAGRMSPDRIPLLRGLAPARPGESALKALCAAFGTTSAAPMLHVDGITCEAFAIDDGADCLAVSHEDLRRCWALLNDGPEAVELVALGSPHASLAECRDLAHGLGDARVAVATIVTVGRATLQAVRDEGILDILQKRGVQVISDLCWCSICEPVFPPHARTVMTNSGKYAHYGPGLSGRAVRLGNLAQCIRAALTGHAATELPAWLSREA